MQHIHESSPSAFPNGCHVAEVEIDPETGVIAVVKYSMVNDFGVIVNPLLVDGQAHGGVVQGIGQALMERTVFDEDGQLLTGSFTDYALPRASDALLFAIDMPPGSGKDQPAGRQGLRRGRLRRIAAGGDERGGRRACRNTASATSTCRRPRSKSGRQSEPRAKCARSDVPGKGGGFAIIVISW